MTTHGIIGTITADHTAITARTTVRCDGYPTWMLPALAQIISTHGADALAVITGTTPRPGNRTPATDWDSLNVGTPDPATLTPETVLSDLDNAERVAYSHLAFNGFSDEARDLITPGYGMAYTDGPEPLSDAAPLSSLTNWGFSEHAYLFTPDGTCHVYACTPENLTLLDSLTPEELAEWDSAEFRARAERAECGEDYERCPHMAYYHVPGADPALSMSEHLAATAAA